MKRLSTLLPLTALLTGLLASQASLARAEDVPKDDVSDINGQLVPVGEHNEYRYSRPKYNVSINPLGIILGFYGVSGAYAVHPNVTVRADVNYYAPVDSDTTGYELSVGTPIYFKRTWSGVFLEPGFVYRNFDDGDALDGDADGSVVGPQILVGWHWYWDSGLNVSAAVGTGRDLGDTDRTFGNAYLRFGYAF
jgi:hypothetical protein